MEGVSNLMLYVLEDGTIRLTRGDTARLTVDISNDLTQNFYEIQDGDVLTLTVKKTIKDTTACLQKTANSSNMLYIQPEDTSELEFRKYVYDVQLTTAAGDVYTVIEPSTFEIMPEVTY